MMHMWLSDRPSCVFAFHTTKEEIMDVQWCPFRSTVFACALANGKIEVDYGTRPLLGGNIRVCRFGMSLFRQSSPLPTTPFLADLSPS